mgnify:CR=1 FL=1
MVFVDFTGLSFDFERIVVDVDVGVVIDDVDDIVEPVLDNVVIDFDLDNNDLPLLLVFETFGLY